MEVDLNVFQRIGRPDAAQFGNHPVFVQSAIDPRQVPQASRGKEPHLAILVIE